MWSIEECDQMIDIYKDNTAYFDGTVEQEFMLDMLRNRMYFGEAEANVIVAALIKAGAKFE